MPRRPKVVKNIEFLNEKGAETQENAETAESTNISAPVQPPPPQPAPEVIAPIKEETKATPSVQNPAPKISIKEQRAEKRKQKELERRRKEAGRRLQEARQLRREQQKREKEEKERQKEEALQEKIYQKLLNDFQQQQQQQEHPGSRRRRQQPQRSATSSARRPGYYANNVSFEDEIDGAYPESEYEGSYEEEDEDDEEQQDDYEEDYPRYTAKTRSRSTYGRVDQTEYETPLDKFQQRLTRYQSQIFGRR